MDSVVLASFNVRKLGNPKNKSKQSWELLTRFCEQCDLIAIHGVTADELRTAQLSSALSGSPLSRMTETYLSKHGH